MATLNELAYNIRNIARNGQGNSDDERINIRQIRFWIRSWRARLVKQQTDYGKHIDPHLIQDLGCLPLKEVDMSDPKEADAECIICPEWGCTIKKATIPKLVDLPKGRALLFVGKLDKRTAFIMDDPDVSLFKEHTQFGKIISRTYLINNTLYFKFYDGDSSIEYVNVRGVFEDPEKVDTYATPGCTAKCYNYDDEYPMPMSMYEDVVQGILSQELNMTLQTPNDLLNNSQQDEAQR
jgi:hypothetical protein